MKHTGGHKVGKGTYWNFDSGERVDVADEAVLPGGEKTVYYRMPAAGIFVAGPVLGLLYAAFLPFIGIAMVLKLAAAKMAGSLAGVMRSSTVFEWAPGAAYLAGKKRATKAEAGKKEEKDRGPDKS